MKILGRTYTSICNENLRIEMSKVIHRYKALNYFNYIDPNVINITSDECINLGGDISGVTDHYVLLNIYQRDPFLNQLKYTKKQTFHYKELELSQVKMLNSNVRVGVMLNQERSRLFKVHNGMYRTIQINKKYFFVCVYGQDKKIFSYDVDFNPNTKQGQWFQKFEFALLEVVGKYLMDIEHAKRNPRCLILREF